MKFNCGLIGWLHWFPYNIIIANAHIFFFEFPLANQAIIFNGFVFAASGYYKN